MIATANGELDNAADRPIDVYRVTAKIVDQKSKASSLVLHSHRMTNFSVAAGAARGSNELLLTHIKWIANEDTLTILIGMVISAGTLIEVFSLVKRALVPIHPIYLQKCPAPSKADEYKETVSPPFYWNIYELVSFV